MKVSGSFLSSKNIPQDLEKLNDTDIDYIHVDVMDGKFTENRTMPFSEMRHISDYTSKRLDVHLMVKEPSKYIPMYAELNCEYITFHIESSEDIKKNIDLIKGYSIKCGLAISPDTKISSLIPYLPDIDLILVMSVVPGRGEQEFIEKTRRLCESVLADCVYDGITDFATIRNRLRDAVSKFIYQSTKRNPMVLPVIMEV